MHPINIISLKKAYGNIHALRGIDLQIPEGKIYGLIGPNATLIFEVELINVQ